MSTTQYGMVIDLHKCVGCGGCDLACKVENNVPDGFAWANHIIETDGAFPDVRYRHIPTLCNHCTNAPCVTNCPTSSMHKSDGGITMHDPDLCIGCRACQVSCPYGVIWFNDDEPHRAFREDDAAYVPHCTATGKELTERGDGRPPHHNPERPARQAGVVEKCTFCHHRVAKGQAPWCVVTCPADARIFGDLNDPKSPPRQALAQHAPRVLQPEKGTRPNVLYIRDF